MLQRLGYLVPEFPNLTHAFFAREIDAIESLGVPVRIYSTRRPPADACPHAFGPQMAERTSYVFPPSPETAVWLATHPLRAAAAAAYIAGLGETNAAGKAKLMALLPSAAMLALDAKRNGVDHLHIHSCANAAHLGALANILTGLPYSLSLHGDLPVYGTDHAAKMKRASFVAAVTSPLAQQVAEVSPKTRAPVVWMGVDSERFAPREKAANSGPFTVATVARLNQMKGHRYFLDAMAELRQRGVNVRYLIAGEGPERQSIEAHIAALGLEDQVEMLGSLGENEVLELLHRVDAVALTSFGQGEAAPVTVMEAMSCGLPVVCSLIGGTGDMITHGYDGLLVPQQDVAAIASAVERIVSDPAFAAKIGAAARQTALKSFDSRANAARLLAEITR